MRRRVARPCEYGASSGARSSTSVPSSIGLAPVAWKRSTTRCASACAEIPVDYTGGSHRSMGIVPPSRQAECHVDYGECHPRHERRRHRARSRASATVAEPLDPSRADEIGEERDRPLSRRQMLWLKYRFGVYFPWKVYVELIPNRCWGEKSRGAGKSLHRQARAFFPQGRRVDRASSFRSRSGGRPSWGSRRTTTAPCTTTGIRTNERAPDHFVTLCPRGRQAPLPLGRGGPGARRRSRAAPTGSTTRTITASTPIPSSDTPFAWTASSAKTSSRRLREAASVGR